MNNSFFIFSEGQGNMLIRLLFAHILADFVFQTKKMVDNKNWVSSYMFAHIGIVYIASALFTGWWVASGIIAIAHYLIDGIKITVKEKFPEHDLTLFLTDQIFHIIILILTWAFLLGLLQKTWTVIQFPFVDYPCSLILLGYLLVTTPVGYLIKYAIKNIPESASGTTGNGGKIIGIFERIIIFTFVLLEQYEAIGFLITGKSIIRFANNQEEHIRSEYVLVGTMMSYAFAIIIGIIVNWLLKIYVNT
ncbi:MAG: DUF3307 domain-containing protein [Cytophagales bacterium]|nr:DUF3307 domain-containing protein [Cytophagales bacterium]